MGGGGGGGDCPPLSDCPAAAPSALMRAASSTCLCRSEDISSGCNCRLLQRERLASTPRCHASPDDPARAVPREKRAKGLEYAGCARCWRLPRRRRSLERALPTPRVLGAALALKASTHSAPPDEDSAPSLRRCGTGVSRRALGPRGGNGLETIFRPLPTSRHARSSRPRGWDCGRVAANFAPFHRAPVRGGGTASGEPWRTHRLQRLDRRPSRSRKRLPQARRSPRRAMDSTARLLTADGEALHQGAQAPPDRMAVLATQPQLPIRKPCRGPGARGSGSRGRAQPQARRWGQ